MAGQASVLRQFCLRTVLRVTPNFYFPVKRVTTMAEQPIKDIKFDALKDPVLNGNITLIDVREPNELKEDGKIPNSVNIPLGEITEAFRLKEIDFQMKYGIPKPHETDEFVISCRSGKRATNAHNKLLHLGYNSTLVYTGSFVDWVKNSGPTEKS